MAQQEDRARGAASNNQLVVETGRQKRIQRFESVDAAEVASMMHQFVDSPDGQDIAGSEEPRGECSRDGEWLTLCNTCATDAHVLSVKHEAPSPCGECFDELASMSFNGLHQ